MSNTAVSVLLLSLSEDVDALLFGVMRAQRAESWGARMHRASSFPELVSSLTPPPAV